MTESEIATKVFSQFDIDARKKLASYPEGDLIFLHHGVGQDIRNEFKLWETVWEPELVDGIDYSENHPDAISSRVIKQLWERCVIWEKLNKESKN